MLALAGLVLVEQLYRNVQPQQRWGIKFLCLGLGGIFACDFYLYSDTLLFRRVNADIWAARGVVDALAVPLLAVATARNPALVARRVDLAPHRVPFRGDAGRGGLPAGDGARGLLHPVSSAATGARCCR